MGVGTASGVFKSPGIVNGPCFYPALNWMEDVDDFSQTLLTELIAFKICICGRGYMSSCRVSPICASPADAQCALALNDWPWMGVQTSARQRLLLGLLRVTIFNINAIRNAMLYSPR